MSISPASDILLDVINAAEPSAVEKARERLAAAAKIGSADTDTMFGDIVTGSTGSAIANTAPVKPPVDVSTKFEGMVLQSFIEAILPKDSENTFGSGLSGDIWKSMLAEKIAAEVARDGGIGIANRILGDFVLDGENKRSIAGANEVSSVVERSRADDATTTVINEKLLDFLSLLGVDRRES